MGYRTDLAASRDEPWKCSVTAERWQEIKQLLATALELEPSQRSAFLNGSCGGDVALHEEVERLLASEQSVRQEFLNTRHFDVSVAAVFSNHSFESFATGRRLGPYRIVELLGTGGMGEVYRAIRDDDQYRKEVALKIVRAGQDSDQIISRFKNERQILATLDHPGIARLLDGGTTPDGVPYFVMELVDGLPVTEYCDRKRLTVAERLNLFVEICSAVQYAHQHLVIHRDIKPGNILVTEDGTPKLLDFGIARLHESDPEQASTTMTAFRILTPRYASPEQIKGEAISTASDVYSLGVVLYELLTGQSPYRLATGSPQEIAHEACTSEPQKPSLAVQRHPSKAPAGSASVSREDLSAVRGCSPERLKRQLRGDLDNIVVMALRNEPARRYLSVEKFADDIRRHLNQLPVSARQDTFGYRTSKFVRRHRGAVVVSTVASLAVLMGFGVAVYEARVARLQRARAERRFNDVRKMANSLMFEAHDSIKDLPGSMPARKVLINGAQQYLDSLSQEANGDIGLQRELAAAYDRVGDLLGYTGSANLGDFAGARQSYLKALAIREAAAAASPDDARAQADLINDYMRLAFALGDAGEFKDALNTLQKALPIAQKLADRSAEPVYKEWLAGVYWLSGHISLQSDNPRAALDNFRLSVKIRESIALDPKADPYFRTHLAGDYIGLGKSLGRMGDLGPALENTTMGVQLLESLLQSDSNNATLREYLGEAYDTRSTLLRQKGQLEDADAYATKSYEVFRELHSTDPTNSLARDNLSLTAMNLGHILNLRAKPQLAQPYLEQAIGLLEPVHRKNRYELAGLRAAYFLQAQTCMSLFRGDTSASKKKLHLQQAHYWYQKSLETGREVSAESVRDSVEVPNVKVIESELANCDTELAKRRL
jgi:non-specific serine/threonine protein kinase/serine/threonine-protein kinase